MQITSQHNRFYRALVKEFRNQLVAPHKDDVEAQKVTAQMVKDLLANQNPDYPRDKFGLPISTTKIAPKELNRHIEWIIREGGHRGFTFLSVEEDWQRIMQQANGL